jgi:cellobiose-specific phosphotransferase system component IIA
MSVEVFQNVAEAATGSAHQQIQISKEAVKQSLHKSQTNYIQPNATESSIFNSSTSLS